MKLLKKWSQRVPPDTKRRLRPLHHAMGVLTCGGDLTRLCSFFGSDKALGHRYTQHYETHFRPWRKRALTLLEIGVGGNDDPRGGGASLRTWKAYFPRARIYGIDIQDKSWHDERRIKTFKGSQDDPVFLRRVVEEIGPPDIVIDDGSHRPAHIIRSFETLFPLMKEDALYVCEDLQTSYWPEFGGNETSPDDPSTSMGYFKALIHGLNFAEFRSDTYVPKATDRTITEIHFYHNLVFIRKGRNDDPSFAGVGYLEAP